MVVWLIVAEKLLICWNEWIGKSVQSESKSRMYFFDALMFQMYAATGRFGELHGADYCDTRRHGECIFLVHRWKGESKVQTELYSISSIEFINHISVLGPHIIVGFGVSEFGSRFGSRVPIHSVLFGSNPSFELFGIERNYILFAVASLSAHRSAMHSVYADANATILLLERVRCYIVSFRELRGNSEKDVFSVYGVALNALTRMKCEVKIDGNFIIH